MKNLESIVYDHIFVGGGLASLFAAYATLSAAKAANTHIDILVIAQEIKAPVTAGSHWVQQIEGMMAGPEHNENFEAIRSLLSDSRLALGAMIAREQIDCRFVAGYEIKAKSKEELDGFIQTVSQSGVAGADELTINSDHQTFRLSGYGHSAALSSIGQVNSPELLNGIVTAIERLGGRVLTGTTYTGHAVLNEGEIIVETSGGTFHARNKPFLGVGALHARTLPDFDFGGTIAYTGALVLGPLSDDDARKISDAPMAICDINVNDDVFWGGLDPKNMLTVGQGALESADEIPVLAAKLADIANGILPAVTENYPATLSTGPMLITENAMPVVGRMKDYDIATGWAGLGIVPAFAAARAFADLYVNGDDSALRLFESMQPKGFSGSATRAS